MVKFVIYQMIFWVLLSLHWLAFARNLGEAPADANYENQWHRIYKRFHHQPMTSQEWSQVLQNQTSDSYSIRKGDNLWDISRTLFGDSNYWPKLWSVNSNIANPHQVSVGQQLYFIMGDESGAPQLGISENLDNENAFAEENTSGSGAESVNADGELAGERPSPSVAKKEKSCSPVLSEVLRKRGITKVYNEDWKCRSVKARLNERKNQDQYTVRNSFNKATPVFRQLGQIPTSLPELEIILDEEQKEMGVSTAQFPTFPNNSVILRFMTNKNDVKIVGAVKRIEDYLPVVTSEVIVALDIPADTGQMMSVIRPLQRVSSGKIAVKDPSGYEVMMQAVIQIKAPVPNQQGHYFAEVKKLYGSLSRSSQIIEGGALFFSMKDTQQWGNGQAQLAGISSDQSSNTLMLHSFVYVNQGTNQNINKGELFKIWANPQFHQMVGTRPIGEVLIVHASNRVATGFVTRLDSEAYVGDFIRPRSSASSYEWDSTVDDVYEEKTSTPDEDFLDDSALDDDSGFDESSLLSEEATETDFDEPEAPVSNDKESLDFDEEEEDFYEE